ncbi:MAG: fructose-1,6-bisphosphatase [Isosphaeraceae bacterium]|nr:MAG: fructose-1,6-bisphosphatase [Isosphaeraceae bacterium]
MDLVRVTEAAAIAASAWIGTGQKEEADRAATEAMRDRLNRIDFAARVVIGEGQKDKSYGLYWGEVVGARREEVLHGSTSIYEICVDPIEGTRPVVSSGPEALSVLGVASFAEAILPSQTFYSLKLAYGPRIAKYSDIRVDAPLSEIVCQASKALGKSVDRMVVCILDRPRHAEYIQQLRRLGVRIKLIQDCDLSGAVATCLPDSGVDLLYGVGGTPESVLAACAMKCLGGNIQTQLADDEGRPRPGRIYMADDLVRGDCVFVATGITSGSLLRGIRFTERGAVTHSVFMRSRSGTIRWLRTEHGN